jgi:hypothetical protein
MVTGRPLLAIEEYQMVWTTEAAQSYLSREEKSLGEQEGALCAVLCLKGTLALSSKMAIVDALDEMKETPKPTCRILN